MLIVWIFPLLIAFLGPAFSVAGELTLKAYGQHMLVAPTPHNPYWQALKKLSLGKTKSRAQLTVAVDMSGSAHMLLSRYKRLAFEAEAFLEALYDEVDLVQVEYTDRHRLEIDRSVTAIKSGAGGGSDYAKAFYGARVSTYLSDHVDHYVIIMGDFEESFRPRQLRDLDYLDQTATGVILVNMMPTLRSREGLARNLELFESTFDNIQYVSLPNECAEYLQKEIEQ